MFFTKKRIIKNEVFKNLKSDYVEVLNVISELLKANQNIGQYKYITRLMESIEDNKDYDKTYNMLNSIDMWGGSGAVWEVYFHDNQKNELFEKQILKLISLMEKSQKLTRNVKRIRRTLKSGATNSIKWDKQSAVKIKE